MTTLVWHTRRQLRDNGALIGLAAGAAVLLAGALHLFDTALPALASAVSHMPLLGAALAATVITALATGAGALPVLFAGRISARAQNTMLGFAAGVMLAASVFSLILPAIDAGTDLYGNRSSGFFVAFASVAIGALTLLAIDKLLPHQHSINERNDASSRRLSRVWLFVFAITLHNIPEGLAVGVGFAGGDSTRALPLALGIAIQNVPEGLAVAATLLTINYSPARAALIAFATGLVEPLGGLLGAGAIAWSGALLPWGLAFAAGAMLFVVVHEIIPETRRSGHQAAAMQGLATGFVMMTLFDTMLG